MESSLEPQGKLGPKEQKHFVHPLAITFICDHFTRTRLGGTHLPTDSPVIGLLFGTENGSDVEVVDATEAIYAIVDSTPVLNMTEIETKRKLWLEVYKSYRLIGWYGVGEISQEHMAIHQKIASSLCDNPLFLLMSGTEGSSENINNQSQLPLRLFRSESVPGAKGVNSSIFVNVKYSVMSSAYENFAVDAIVKSTPRADGVSAMETSNRSIATSLSTLANKVQTIIKCLRVCQSTDDSALRSSSEFQGFLREVQRITARLPVPPGSCGAAMDTGATGPEETPETPEMEPTEEVMEALMTTYLASVTHNRCELMELADKVKTAYGKDMSLKHGMSLAGAHML